MPKTYDNRGNEIKTEWGLILVLFSVILFFGAMVYSVNKSVKYYDVHNVELLCPGGWIYVQEINGEYFIKGKPVINTEPCVIINP